MTSQAEAIRDCEEQLAQVRARIADALESRKLARTQKSWRIVNQRLGALQMLEWDIVQDMKRCAA